MYGTLFATALLSGALWATPALYPFSRSCRTRIVTPEETT